MLVVTPAECLLIKNNAALSYKDTSAENAFFESVLKKCIELSGLLIGVNELTNDGCAVDDGSGFLFFTAT